MLRTVVSITLLIGLATPTSARGEIAWAGFGTASCAEFAELYREDPGLWERTFFGWAQGFMSGLNTPLLKEKQSADLNPASRNVNDQMRQVREYCNRKPLASYVDAVLELYDELRARQGLRNWRQ